MLKRIVFTWLAETPKSWLLKFQKVAIFADNFGAICRLFYLFAYNLVVDWINNRKKIDGQ